MLHSNSGTFIAVGNISSISNQFQTSSVCTRWQVGGLDPVPGISEAALANLQI